MCQLSPDGNFAPVPVYLFGPDRMGLIPHGAHYVYVNNTVPTEGMDNSWQERVLLRQVSLVVQQGGDPDRTWRSFNTHLRSTAISFSMLVSFPFSAFLGMHLIATIFSVAFS